MAIPGQTSAEDRRSRIQRPGLRQEFGVPPPARQLRPSGRLHLRVAEKADLEHGRDSSQHGLGNPYVRADIVYFETPNGGGVFSASSITWCSALSYDGYDNNVSRITGNVMRRFAADDPLG